MKISEIEKRCEAATPGEWAFEVPSGENAACWCGINDNDETLVTILLDRPEQRADVAFIAAARTDLPALLSWAKRARPCVRASRCWCTYDSGKLVGEKCERCELLEEMT